MCLKGMGKVSGCEQEAGSEFEGRPRPGQEHAQV